MKIIIIIVILIAISAGVYFFVILPKKKLAVAEAVIKSRPGADVDAKTLVNNFPLSELKKMEADPKYKR